MPEDTLPAGKLPSAILERMLSALPRTDPRIVLGPQLGEDAAVIDAGDRYLVATTDPITFATDNVGWYCVHVNANDVAVLGAMPRWFFAVLLLPDGRTPPGLAETITGDIARTCLSLGVTLCGGHTEVTPAVNQPVVIGQMLGEVDKDRLVRKDRLQPGDRILLTRGVAIEGTAILAREKFAELEPQIGRALLESAMSLLFNPGISVVAAAQIAVKAGTVHAMHDPTEGGVASGLWEVARAGRCGLRVHADAITLLPETKAICDVLRVDPLRLIASGSLLIAAEQAEASKIFEALEANGIAVADIGCAAPVDDGTQIEVSGRWMPLEPAERDEVARVLAG